MEEKQAKSLVSRLRRQGYEARVYEGYSGRGMYGRTTFGVETSVGQIKTKFSIRSDNLGLNYIYY